MLPLPPVPMPMLPLPLLVPPLPLPLPPVVVLLLPRRRRWKWQARRLAAEEVQPVGHRRPPLQGRWRRVAPVPSPLPVMS